MNQKTTKAYYQEENDWVLLKCKTGAVVVRPAGDKIPEEEIIERFHGTRLEASDRAVALESGDFTENNLFDFGLANPQQERRPPCSKNEKHLDVEKLRNAVRDDCMAAYFGAGIGPALMEASIADTASAEKLVEMAKHHGIDPDDYRS